MGLFVDTTGADVPIEDLGITLIHPTTNYDIGDQFSAQAVAEAVSLTSAITGGTLAWKKTSGGAIEAAVDYDPDWLHAEEVNLGTGEYDDQVVLRKDLDVLVGAIVVYAVIFTKSGNSNSGDSLDYGTVPTDRTGSPLIGSNQLLGISITNQDNVGTSVAEVIVTYRVSEAAFADVAGSEAEVPIGEYANDTPMDILLPDNVEIGVRLTDASSQLKNPVVSVYLRRNGPSSP